MPDGIELRCSVIVIRQHAVLLIHRTYDSTDDWVLPGGTPREGESMAACARREIREETGLRVDPARVAFVLEVVGPHSGPRTLDIVFAATESPPSVPPEGLEPGMEPLFVPVDRIGELDLRPPLAGHLRGLLSRGRDRYAPYLADMWRPAGGPADGQRLRRPHGGESVSMRVPGHASAVTHRGLPVHREQLQAAAEHVTALDVADLRRQVETGPPAGPGCATMRAVGLADGFPAYLPNGHLQGRHACRGVVSADTVVSRL